MQGRPFGSPIVWPEHCVDLQLIADHDVVVIGGPDTNFWHAALFEAVASEFEQTRSSVPLAFGMRDTSHSVPVYGSRSLHVRLASPAELPKSSALELDERIFPTYSMILLARNPFAAAVGKSRWCVFAAGSRSLGSSEAVMALAAMIRTMTNQTEGNFASTVATSVPDVYAQVSAVLCRVSEVESAMIRRGDGILQRDRRRLEPIGLDSEYSDTYIPTEIEYLSFAGIASEWKVLSQIRSGLVTSTRRSLPAGGLVARNQ